MNITTFTSSNDTTSTANIDKKVRVYYRANKKNKRTYIEGLELFTDAKTITDFCNKIKKTLGTSSISEQDEETGQICHGFQGNHVAKIKQFVTNDLSINPEKIV